jgi:hypothetical protein
MAERWADGDATEQQLFKASLDAGPARLFNTPRRTDSPEYTAAMAAMHASSPAPSGHSEVGAIWSAYSVIEDTIESLAKSIAEPASIAWWQHPIAVTEAAELTKVVRDLFGPLPFRPVACDPSWLTSTVTALARQMYESRNFTPMPILADALQDAGCDHPDILAHCRGDGPHARGCWVVDLVLGLS